MLEKLQIVATCNTTPLYKIKFFKWWNSSMSLRDARQFSTRPVFETLLGPFLNRCVWYVGVSVYFFIILWILDPWHLFSMKFSIIDILIFAHRVLWICNANCSILSIAWRWSCGVLWEIGKRGQHPHQHESSIVVKDLSRICRRMEEEDLRSRVLGHP